MNALSKPGEGSSAGPPQAGPHPLGGSADLPARRGAHMPPVVVYENVRKLYGDFVALDGIDVRVNKGEVMCLIGPSGSGKSTLLRCTNALETLSSGLVLIDGLLSQAVVVFRIDSGDVLLGVGGGQIEAGIQQAGIERDRLLEMIDGFLIAGILVRSHAFV